MNHSKSGSATLDIAEIDNRHCRLYTDEARDYDRNRFSFRRGRLYHLRQAQTILELLAPLQEKRILDVATGTGRIALALGQAGACVIGCDLTYGMLQAAQDKCHGVQGQTGTWVNANGRILPFSDHSFDIVTSVRFLHLLPPAHWPWFLDEMHRVLKPEGTLLLELFNPFYGGLLSLGRQLRSRMRGTPGEQYVWPWELADKLRGFNIVRIIPFWLPGMGLLSHERSFIFRQVGRLSACPGLKWVAGPFLVLANPLPTSAVTLDK